MNVTYQNPGYAHSIESILLFQTEEQTPFWSDAILHFYPEIDGKALAARTPAERKTYLEGAFAEIYERTAAEMDRKAADYNAHFAKYKGQLEEALSDAFELDARPLFNDLTGNVTLNPICPRFLQERYFDVFYMNSERGALGLSMHEVIHYFWFHVWNRHFGDSYDEYETPSLKWILSEMVVEALMSDPRLSTVNPYFPKENGGCVYPYFQDMIVDGTPVLARMAGLYQHNGITGFMEAAYAYCVKHEQAIRRHIAEAEKTF